MTPTNGLIEVDLVETATTTPAGIILPNPELVVSREGTIVAVDPDVANDKHCGFLKPGLRVLFHVSAIREAVWGGKRRYYVHIEQIMATAPGEVKEVVN